MLEGETLTVADAVPEKAGDGDTERVPPLLAAGDARGERLLRDDALAVADSDGEDVAEREACAVADGGGVRVAVLEMRAERDAEED